jgi:hypothetical protein
MGRRSLLPLLTLLGVTLAACASPPVLIAAKPPEQFEKLGRVTGTACGSLGLGGTGYYFIPIMLNSRVERAYQRALANVPGATALIDTEVKESWYWWVLVTTRCTTITGEAIR